MKDFRGLTWLKIESSWQSMRARREEAELERAILLRQLRDTEPWLDRNRFASQAAADEMFDYTFNDVLRYCLFENVLEVHNTLRILDAFGDATFKKYGRRALLRVYNRVDRAQRPRALRELDKAMKASGRRPSGATISRILDKITPRKRKSDTIGLVRTLKGRIETLKKANARLQHDLSKSTKQQNRAVA